MRAKLPRCLLLSIMACLPFTAFGQDDYIGRFDLFNGFTYFESPHINLAERGYHLQAGVNMRTWYSLGFDYSVVNGNTSLTPNLLPDALQQQLAGELAQLEAEGVIPPGYQLSVPISSTTQTFAAGPQLIYRHFSHVALFIRPSIGAVREEVTPHATDAVTAAIIEQLVPSGKKLDWTGFYGVGGGLDIGVARHLKLRFQADFVHDHLFNDLLKDGRNTIRVSVGPAVAFGRNIRK